MKRKKPSRGIYYVMAIICLVIMFTGYNLVETLSLRREARQEKEVVSIEEFGNKITNNYNELFAKIMSYFNVFFKETFKEYNDSGLFNSKVVFASDKINNKNIVENSSQDKVINIDELELYLADSDDVINNVRTTILLANNLKQDFYTFSSAVDTIKMDNYWTRNVKEQSEAINGGVNVVIYHTHGTEGYKENKKNGYRSSAASENIVGIGSIITNDLVNYGLNVVHLEKCNDIPSYSNAYASSRKLVLENLVENKKNVIIDIHRDGADDESNYEKVLESVTRVKMNDKYIATFALVVGGGNENRDKVLGIAKLVEETSNELYPGLCRGIIIRETGFYNQNISDYSLLLEIGSHLNTIEEAKIAADYISEILYKFLIKINN